MIARFQAFAFTRNLYRYAVVNAPTVFSVIWAVVKQFLDPKTVAKVHIMGRVALFTTFLLCVKNTVQLATAGMVHVTNLLQHPPGVGSEQSPGQNTD